MSIFTRTISGAVFCALFLGTASVAQPNLPPLGVMVAQSTAVVLSDQDIRRINYYSAQTLATIQGVGASVRGAENTENLRQKVQRLLDAGKRSGLDIASTADYFKAYCAENARTPMPDAFLDSEGQFDAAGLLSSVELFYQSRAQVMADFTASDEADMAAISSVAQRHTPQSVVGQSPELTVPATVVELPVIAPNTPAALRVILERVRLRGETWVITVEQGDSLSEMAVALYGNRQLFLKIFEANSTVLITPSTITVGQELVLPKP